MLDASAVLVYLRDEPGSETIEELILAESAISSVILAREVGIIALLRDGKHEPAKGFSTRDTSSSLCVTDR